MTRRTIIPELRTAVVAAFTDAGHTAYKHHPADTNTTSPKTFVYLDEATEDQEYLTFGGAKVGDISLFGVVWVMKPGADAAAAETAETEALDIYGALEAALETDSTLGSTAFDINAAEIVESIVGADDGHRVARVRFRIEAEAHI